jgi:hypothetical protein
MNTTSHYVLPDISELLKDKILITNRNFMNRDFS